MFDLRRKVIDDSSSGIQLLDHPERPQYRSAHSAYSAYSSASHREPSPEIKPIHSVGKPTPKPCLDFGDVFALITCGLCLAAAIIVLAPTTIIPFKLGTTNQLIVIGFLVAIMNVCPRRVVGFVFLLIEARFGASRLQSYDALLRCSPVMPQTSTYWRTIVATLIVIPFVLAAKCKRFVGGVSTSAATENSLSFGMTPPGLSGVGVIRLSLMANATLPSIDATGTNTTIDYSLCPQTYGHNTIRMSDSAAAALDLPAPSAILQLQVNSLRILTSN